MKPRNQKPVSPDRQVEMILTSINRLTVLAQARLDPGKDPQTGPDPYFSTPSVEPIRLQWTYPKVGLIELIYALKELGVFNHGKADLKTITKCFEYMFCIDLGNVSSSFQEIRERKKGFATIIDKLRSIFIKKIGES